MFHRSCAFCSQPAAAAVNLGPLLGPIRDPRAANPDGLFAHRLCALWSSEVFETDRGTLRNVLAAIKRGRLMKCAHCGRRGATLGCRVASCSCSFHVACAKEAGCTYYCDQFLIACPSHCRQFTEETHQQARRTPFTPFRLPTADVATDEREHTSGAGLARLRDGEALEEDLLPPPTELFLRGRKRGRRQEAVRAHILRAAAAMKRARRDMESQRHRAAESSDDEEHFQKKEARRLARDTAKLNPITLNGDGTAVQHVFVKSPAPGKAAKQSGLAGSGLLESGQRHTRRAEEAAQQPQDQQQRVETAAVGSIAATDFSCVAGLDGVVRQLREMVLLPLQYPELFGGMGLRPPRGILFHGAPGTGKTLAARALAGACARHSPLPVTFFARKGADCLGKFHGEAERTLRLLFEEAARRAPAIIFLDELDALAPARAARAGGCDQIYASVVAALLSLMDGVSDRGHVIVIGATNRPEAIDPALRRPGRFDREVHFGLPSPEQRLAILRTHTQRWAAPPQEDLLRKVAAAAEGAAGADLAALAAAAVLAAVRRSAPALIDLAEREADAVAAAAQREEAVRPQEMMQVPQELPGAGWKARRQRLLEGVTVEHCDWQAALAAAPPPCSRRDGLAALAAAAAAPLQRHALPLVAPPLAALLAALHAADLPLPPPATAVARAASTLMSGGGDGQQLEAALAAALERHGALLPPADVDVSGLATAGAAQNTAVGSAAGPPAADESAERQPGRLGRSHAPCRLLLWGAGEQGQEEAAGAVLRLLDGCPVHCLSLPSLVAEGGEDAAAGCVALVQEALRRAAPHTPCVFFLPRLESWALSRAVLQAEELEGAGWCCPAPVEAASSSSSGGPAGTAWPQRGALSSPRHAVTSPVGASPAHRGFRLAPSPFSGLLPLEDRVAATPAVARSLRPSVDRPVGAAAGTPRHRDVANSGLEPPTGAAAVLVRRTRDAAQETALVPTPMRQAPGAVNSTGGAAIAAGPTGLLAICTSPQQLRALLPGTAPLSGQAAVGGGGLPRRATPTSAGREADEEEEAEGGAEVEAVCLSQAWNLFEALMRQAPATQPIIVLATCHADADGVPANLIRFFAGPAAAEGAQTARQAAPGSFAAAATSGVAAVAAPSVVRMAAPSGGAWRRASAAAADHAAAVVAAQAATLLHQRLSQALQDGHSDAAARPSSSCEVQEQQQQQQQERGVGPSTQPQQQEQQAVLQGQQAAPPAAAAESELWNTAAWSTAELEGGLRLFSQLLSFQQQLAASLRAERVAALDRWAASVEAQRRRGASAAPAQLPPTFSAIAERCEGGEYDEPAEIQADAAAATAHVLAVVQRARRRAAAEARRRGRATPAGGGQEAAAAAAVTAACSLQDKIETACFWLRQQLQLGEERVAQLLAAAAEHVRRLQRERDATDAAAAMQPQADPALGQQAGAGAGQTQQLQSGEGTLPPQQPVRAASPAGALPGAAGSPAEEPAVGPAAAAERQQQDASEDGLQGPAPGSQPDTTPALTEPTQQQQGQAEEVDARDRFAQEQRRHVAAAARLLQQRLAEGLRGPLAALFPPAPPLRPPGSWQALQEAAGRAAAAAAAACMNVLTNLERLEAVPLQGLHSPDEEALLGALTSALATRCVAALRQTQQPDAAAA